jgi:hypothetical protein
MKRSIIIGLSIFCVGIFFSPGVFAESKAGKILGERASCLDIVNIKETKILDNQTILFETYGGKVYINRLPADCFDLKSEDAFSYETSLDRLCKQDIITVLVRDSRRGTSCGLGEFVEIKGVKRIGDAVKLLVKDGALKELVDEGVFEEAFPQKKDK